MKLLTDKKLILILILAGILFLTQNDSIIPSLANFEEAQTAAVYDEKGLARADERVIYICRLGNEEVPAVQISEVKDETGRVREVLARLQTETVIEIRTPETEAVWDYKSISARSAASLIEIAYEPDGGREGFDWLLTLMDQNTFQQVRVRDCQEVSDE